MVLLLNNNNNKLIFFYYKFIAVEVFVKLNLFNHVLALFYAKFAYNLAIRYPLFRWDLCKGNV